MRGTTAVTRPTAARTSAIADVRTFSRAREERRRASDASSCVPLSAASARWRSISPLAAAIRSSSLPATTPKPLEGPEGFEPSQR